MIPLSLGRDHKARKGLPILRVLGYFTAAVAGLARHAVRGNAQHNPGERLHWARGKSMDHDECIVRHSLDVLDYQAWLERNPEHPEREAVLTELEHEYDARLWRAAADSQEFYERFRGAPPSPSSKFTAPTPLPRFNPAVDDAPIVLTPDVPEGTLERPAVQVMLEEIAREAPPPPFAEPMFVCARDDGAPRCGHMSRTKRVCVLTEGHLQFHSDGVMNWHPTEG